MIQILCYLVPGLLSFNYFYDKEVFNRADWIKCVSYYLYSVMSNVVLTYVILFLFTGYRYLHLYATHFSVMFTLKYLIVAMPLAFLFPRAYVFIKQHIEIEIETSKESV